MTKEGRLARGKANYEAGIFADNPETAEFMATMKTEKPKAKPKEAENAKSSK